MLKLALAALIMSKNMTIKEAEFIDLKWKELGPPETIKGILGRITYFQQLYRDNNLT